MGIVASEVVSLPDLEMVDRPNPTWLKRFSNMSIPVEAKTIQIRYRTLNDC